MKFNPGDLVKIEYPGCKATKCRLCGLAEIVRLDEKYSKKEENKFYWYVQILNGNSEHGTVSESITEGVISLL